MKFEELKNNKELISQIRLDITPQNANLQNATEETVSYFYINVYDSSIRLELMTQQPNCNKKSELIEGFNSPLLLHEAIHEFGGSIDDSGWYPISKSLEEELKKQLCIIANNPTVLTRDKQNKTKLLSVTLPIEFVKWFDLKQGDMLSWSVVEGEDGEKWLKAVPLRI